jgi:hypothetical protein
MLGEAKGAGHGGVDVDLWGVKGRQGPMWNGISHIKVVFYME